MALKVWEEFERLTSIDLNDNFAQLDARAIAGGRPLWAGGPGINNATVFGGSSALAVGQARLSVVDVIAPMTVTGYSLWNIDVASARACECRLYRDVGTATLEYVAGTAAAFAFTPTVASLRTAAMAAPVTIPAGRYYLACRNTSASQTFGMPVTGNATPAIGLTASWSKLIGALGATLDGTGWAGSGAVPGIIVNGAGPIA